MEEQRSENVVHFRSLLQRVVNRALRYSFLLFGARAICRSAFVREGYLTAIGLYVNLLFDELFDHYSQQIDGVLVLPWRQAIAELML